MLKIGVLFNLSHLNSSPVQLQWWPNS